MELVGHVESLWRYPVKSMRGEELAEVWAGTGGFVGDRRFAFRSSAAPPATPYLTSRTQEQMLRYQPSYPDLAQSTQVQPSTDEELLLDVKTPFGESLSVYDPRLLRLLGQGLRSAQTLSLISSAIALADEYPISLVSMQTVEQLSKEFGSAVDKRRFRANIYASFLTSVGFQENSFVGRKLRIGDKVTLYIVKRDPRCKVITLDPDTGEATPELMRHVAAAYGRCVGVYATVAGEGTIRQGDPIVVVR